MVLNLQRACQIAIDMGMHVIRLKKLGLPKESKEVFALLAEAKLISKGLAERLQKMVGFRNIAVHDYNDIDYTIVRRIVEHRLDDFKALIQHLLKI